MQSRKVPDSVSAHHAGRWRDDGGSALVETFFLAVVLLIPLTWVMLAAFSAQRTAYACAAAAREAARAYVTTPGTASAPALRRAREATAVVMTDFDRADSKRDLTVDGSLASGAFVRVTVRTTVALPFLPAFLDGASVPVSAQAVAVVDEYR